MREIQDMVDDYAHQLLEFRRNNPGLESLLGRPDHVAIQTDGQLDFNRIYEAHQLESSEIVTMDIDSNRRVATAALMGSYAMQAFGSADWLQLIYQGPDKPNDAVARVDHVGFLYSDVEFAKGVLDKKGLAFETHESDIESPHLKVGFGPGLAFRLSAVAMENVYNANKSSSKVVEVWKKPIVSDSKPATKARRSVIK